MRKIKYPLIISDFDGTLIKKDGTVSEENKRAIDEYIAAGGKFAISTGRLPSGILSRAKALGLKGALCCCQGAIILDIESEELLLAGKFSLESTLAACEKMEALNLHIHAFDLWEYYANKDDEMLALYERAVGSKAKLVTDRKLSEFIREKGLCAYKLLAMVDPKDNERILQELSAANIKGCALTRSMELLVEVVNAQYSKGTAVEFLANYYGVPVERTVAVGDQCNDISMIERAGVGIAVKNADVALKKTADYILDYTNEEEAIAQVIEKFGFYEER